MAQASARQSLANSMVGALRRKDMEIEELKAALATWRDQAPEKYARLYRNELAQELEKYTKKQNTELCTYAASLKKNVHY